LNKKNTMPTFTLTISKLRFPSNGNISSPITVKLEYKEYYSDLFTLIDSGVNVDVDGTILESPLPAITVDPEFKYVIRCTNELCDFQYEQTIIINPYCPIGYEFSDDETYCFLEEITEATPPTSSENTVAKSFVGYSSWGTLIYDLGFNLDGTGSFTQISFANSFWVNGVGYPNITGTTVDGPLNRSGLWSTTELASQTIGFATCLNILTAGTYYVGVGADNYATIKLNGVTVLNMDPTAMTTFLAANGYPLATSHPGEVAHRFWHLYPVELLTGIQVLEVIGTNTGSVAAMGTEIYNATSAEIQAATSYVDLGSQLIFSTKDEIGNPVQLGSDGIGFTCPVGFSLRPCFSPVDCVRILTTPVLY
jgi:hypothetical protein